MFKIKGVWLAALLGILASCSTNKEIPQGHRISVLNAPQHDEFIENKKTVSLTLSKEETLNIWSQTGSNAEHLTLNISASSNAKELWSKKFGKGADKRNLLLASPVISNGVIYAQDVEGTVFAFDLSSGQKLFKQKLKPLNKSDSDSALNGTGLALDNARLYATTGFGSVFSLNLKDGNILWRKDFNTPIRTAPTVSSNKLFIQTIDNQLFCLNTSDGSEIWSYNISSEDTVLAGTATPAYSSSKDILVAAFSNGELQAFNASIGYPLWSNNLVSGAAVTAASPINAIKASPVIDSNTVYAIGNNDQMLATNLETGDILWKKQIGGVNTPVIDKEALFLVSNNFELIALNKKTGDIFFKTPLLEDLSLKERQNIYLSGPILINSNLLVTTSSGLVLTFDALTGEKKAELDLGTSLPFAPISAENAIIFTTSHSKLIVFK